MKNKIIIIAIVILSFLSIFAITLAFTTKKETFEVSFISDGEVIETIKVKKNSKVSKLEPPIKEGYDFFRWYLDGEIYDFDTKVTKDITLVAMWNSKTNDKSDTFKVIFDTNGGEQISFVSVRNGRKVEKPNDPVRSGYTFVEWQLDGKIYDFNQVVTKDITLVAKWERQHIDNEMPSIPEIPNEYENIPEIPFEPEEQEEPDVPKEA